MVMAVVRDSFREVQGKLRLQRWEDITHRRKGTSRQGPCLCKGTGAAECCLHLSDGSPASLPLCLALRDPLCPKGCPEAQSLASRGGLLRMLQGLPHTPT